MSIQVKILSANGQYALSHDPNNNTVIYPVSEGDPSQVWDLADVNGNFALQVPGTDLYMNYVKPQTPVSLAAYNPSTSVWNASVGNRLNTAIRPVTDTTENLNAFGGLSDGATVGTWPWGGGQPNEVWSVWPVSICAMKLTNHAAYVCQLHFWDVTQNKELKGSGDILNPHSQTVSPTDYGAQNGDTVLMRMIVKDFPASHYTDADEEFTVDKSSNTVACYTAHGTTGNNSLDYDGLLEQ